MIRIGIVVQRYGNEVVGGAETLARQVAERLNASGFDVTVLTTTARDYITWQNAYPEGESVLKGVKVLRHAVEEERDIDAFNSASRDFFAGPAESRDEASWLRKQGPYTPSLLNAIAESQQEIDLFIFFTYLYYSTVEGMKVVEKPVILFPTAHDEPPFYLKAMIDVFAKPDALFFLTGAEMDLVKRTHRPSGRTVLVRTGVDFLNPGDMLRFREKYRVYGPLMLYAGRIEKGKGLEMVFEAYEALRLRRLLDFVLIGKQLMDLPSIPGIKYLGFVTEEEKCSAFKHAIFSVQPSPLESLSITTLESFAQKTPVLVNRRSPALEEHVRMSGGGVAYTSIEQCVQGILDLYDNREMRRRMGHAGFEYVTNHYSWPVVMDKITAGIREILA